jgi:hypothetical protein
MRKPLTIAGIVAVAIAVAAAGAFVSIALAGATPQGFSVPASPAVPVKAEPQQALNLTSLDAINQHLRSRGLDPSTFVVQQGPLNYAGPNCPGAVFNCTTATRVIQIATGGPSPLALLGPTASSAPPNHAECKASPEDEDTISDPEEGVGCVIVQSAPGGNGEIDQQASCKVESKVAEKQICDIEQDNESGGDNQASMTMKIDASKGTTQLGDQEALAFQETRGGGDNQLQVDQTIVLAAQGSATTQDGYQSADFEQDVDPLFTLTNDVPASGNNQAQVSQKQTFTAHTATGGTQNQNADTTAVGDPCRGDVTDANSCVEYDQSTDTGTNEFQANQNHDLKATSAKKEVTQVQGCDPDALFDKPCGLEEVGEQDTDGDEGTKNKSDVVQGGTWVLEAPKGATQTQDPRFGGAGTTQIGGDDDAFTLTQTAVLKALANAVQSHENVVDDQSSGEVRTKSTIVLNNEKPSVVTCSGEGERCTYTQRCSNVEPGIEDPPLFCPRNGDAVVPPTSTTTVGD